MGKSTISMAIFHCYVSLPEGNWDFSWRVSRRKFQSNSPMHLERGKAEVPKGWNLDFNSLIGILGDSMGFNQPNMTAMGFNQINEFKGGL